MKEAWRDTELYFVLSETPSTSGRRIDYTTLLDQFSEGYGSVACDNAQSLSEDGSIGRTIVVAWRLCDGITVVAEYIKGECMPTYAYFSKAIAYQFAPIIMPCVAEYLDTQARSLAPVPADAGPDAAHCDSYQRELDLGRPPNPPA